MEVLRNTRPTSDDFTRPRWEVHAMIEFRRILLAMFLFGSVLIVSRADEPPASSRSQTIGRVTGTSKQLRRFADDYQLGSGAFVELVPVDPTTVGLAPYPPTVTVGGDLVVISEVPQRLWFEIRLGGWGADEPLCTWQISIDTSSFANGVGTDLRIPDDFPCATDEECAVLFGVGAGCYTCTRCSGYQCQHLFQDTTRADLPVNQIALCNQTNQVCGATILPGGDCEPDDGSTFYGGTLVLDAPEGASGMYVVRLLDNAATFLVLRYFGEIPIVEYRAARVMSNAPAGCCHRGTCSTALPLDCLDLAGGVVAACKGDCNGDGLDDACQNLPDCNENDIPDECESGIEDCNQNGIIDDCEFPEGDCNDNGVLDDCETPTDDCNENGVWDECELDAGDCDHNGILDICESAVDDCNDNGISDDCELRYGDCDHNGLLDECELASGADDCNGNGVLDVCEDLGGDCNQDGIPDGCDFPEFDCNANNVLDECDVADGAADCNANLVPDECELADADCNHNGVVDECDTAMGATDCNANAVPDECELDSGDCDHDGTLDVCEFGSSSDCDANGIADECEFSLYPGLDCNENGVLDACDIAEGTSLDTEGNCIPDECDQTPSPLAEELPVPKSRFLSFVPVNAGCTSGIRVRLVSLTPNGVGAKFAGYEGQWRWVGPVRTFWEDTRQADILQAATLQCEPYVRDWSHTGLLHVYGPAIMPESVYEVQHYDAACGDVNDPACFSEPLTITTAVWGDVVPPFEGDAGAAAQPDFPDIAALVMKFRADGGPLRAAAELEPNIIDLSGDMDFKDIAACVTSFQEDPYPLGGPMDCP